MTTEVRVVDRAGVGAVRCELEGGKARIELGKNVNARRVETGYGRLFFRYGKRLSASLKQLIVDDKTPADVGHLKIALTLRESVALVRYFNGVLCAPAAKIDIPRGRGCLAYAIYTDRCKPEDRALEAFAGCWRSLRRRIPLNR
jgi:hypothetical protein